MKLMDWCISIILALAMTSFLCADQIIQMVAK